MGNVYYIQSAKDQSTGNGLCVNAPPGTSGSPLQVINQALSTNAAWTFNLSPDSNDGYYFIQQPGDNGLCVDIAETKGKVSSGSALQLLKLKKESNQYWKVVGGPAGTDGVTPFFYLQSKDDSLVIGIASPAGSGSLLQALKKTSDSTQLWTLISASPDNIFNPALQAGMSYDPPSVTVTGTGFMPGAQVSVSWGYETTEGPLEDCTGGPTLFRSDLNGYFTGTVTSSSTNVGVIGTLNVTASYPGAFGEAASLTLGDE